MSLTPPPPVTRRDWTLPIIAGVVAIVVVLGVCLVGSATAFVSLRRPAAPDTAASAPSVIPGRPNVTGPQCLIGDWLETNGVNYLEIGSDTLPFTGKGAILKFTDTGIAGAAYQNTIYTATAGSNRFELVNNGAVAMEYVADATTIRYSDQVPSGTVTLKVNGIANTAIPLELDMTPETYTCQADSLHLQGTHSSSDLQRLG
jgi:hypothetical protein